MENQATRNAEMCAEPKEERYEDRYEERRARARKERRRKNNLKVFLVMSVFSVFLMFVLYVAVRFYGGGGTTEEYTGQEPVASEEENGIMEASSGAIVYTKEELDAKVKEAVATAENAEAARILEGIKESLSGGTTTVETLRPFYPDDIVVVSGGRFHFVPIDRSLKMSTLLPENLNVLENGEYQYLLDGQVVSHKGIDVSSHQGDIDWQQVAEDGVEFAIIRVAFRGYGSGKLVEDTKFEQNIQGAKAAGIKVGVYLFSQAVNEEELLEEANLVLEKIAPYEIECPVVFDVEKVSDSDGRMNKISVEERTALTALFCEKIAEAGYKPMIYHNTEMAALLINIGELEKYDKWYASYSQAMFYPYEYKIWQYRDTGSVKGIKGAVDMNISFSPIWE